MFQAPTCRPPLLPVSQKDWHPFRSRVQPVKFTISKITEYLFERGPSFDGQPRARRLYPRGKFEEIPAVLDRAMQYVISGNVLRMMDLTKGEHYFVKGEVQASMRNEVHSTSIVISSATGDICDAACTPCKVGELRRCNHVAALMLRVVGFEALNDRGNYIGFEYFECRSVQVLL